jgi:hypothetical protein
MLYFALRAFGFLITFSFNIKQQFQKKNVPISIPHSFPSLFFPFFSKYISFINPICLPSSFSISSRSFSSLVSLHPFHMSSIVFLFLLIAHSAHLLSSSSIQYLFSLSSFSHLNLAVIFLSLALPRYSRISCVIYPSYCLLYHDSLLPSLLSCLSVSLSLSLSSTLIHFPSALNLFPFLHWHTLSSASISLSPSSPCSFSFLSSIHSSLPFILSSNFAVLFPAFTLSLFYSSCTLPSLCSLAFLCPLPAPISNYGDSNKKKTSENSCKKK